MTAEPMPVDISGVPDVLELAEAVRASGRPRLLRRAGEDLALLVPAPPPEANDVQPRRSRRVRNSRVPSASDIAAFRAAAGSWSDVDLDQFLTNNEASRRLARPPVEL